MTYDYKIILNGVRKLMKNEWEKDAEKGPNLKRVLKNCLAYKKSKQIYSKKNFIGFNPR
jgi:hypothetical protein